MRRAYRTLAVACLITTVLMSLSGGNGLSPALAHPDKGHDHGGGSSDPALTEPPAQGATACAGGFAGSYPCARIDLASFLPLSVIGGGRGNDVWGWTDSATRREYALMGRTNGVSFVDVTNPAAPRYLGNLPTYSVSSTWRSIKVFADHAFVVSEALGHGMQVFDLRQLRSVPTPPAIFSETAHYAGFSTAHNVAVNEDTGFAYATGTNTCAGGLHIVDIRLPASPTFAGCFSQDKYTHDVQCVTYSGPDAAYRGREICFASNENTLTIIDATIKSAPVQLARRTYSGRSYTHQGWLTPDHEYFLLDDEKDESLLHVNTRTHIFDVRNLDTPVPMAPYEGPVPATDHNLYVRGSRTFEANYRSGLRILDNSQVANGVLREVAFFDIVPADDKPGYNGAWNTYPFFASGTVLVSGMEQGLYILRPASASLTGTDLVVSHVIGARAADPGGSIPLTATVSSQGSTSAGRSTLGVFLSADTLLGTGDPRIGTADVPPLPAGGAAAIAVNASIPPQAAGAFYLMVRADVTNSVPETIENNNVRTHYVAIGPDLTVSSLLAPASAPAGATITINDVTKNLAQRPSGPTITRFYLSKNGSLDSSDVPLGSRNVAALAAQQSSPGSLVSRIPAGTLSGTHYILAVADADGAIGEVSETNNVRRRGIIVQ